MGELEKYQRATDKELDSILLRIGMVKNQLYLFPEVYDNNGNVISPDTLTKANELQGAGLEYLTSIAEYLYTHFLTAIKKNRHKSALYDALPSLDWGAALEIASGGIKEQKERIERTIMQYHAKPKPVLMFSADGHLHSRQPFIIDFDWGKPEKLGAVQAARLAKLNKAKGKEKANGEARLPIKKITIMAAKPLFEAFMKNNPSTYSFPVGMYAKFFDIANTAKNALLKLQPENPGIMSFDNDTYISAYARVMRFIMRHNNLTGEQMKDKKTAQKIKRISEMDFFTSVYPACVSMNGRGERRVERQKAMRFLINAHYMIYKFPDFKIYPVIIPGGVFLDITLYTDRDAAMRVWERIIAS